MCVILFIVLTAVAAVAGWLAVAFVTAWAAEAGWAVVSAVLVLGPVLALLIHEAGHLLAGVGAGMRPVLMIVGPLGLHWRFGHDLPRLRPNAAVPGGFTFCVPRNGDTVRRRMICMTAGGPVASLLLALLAAAAVLWAGGSLSKAAGVTGTAAAVLFLATAVPYTYGGITSDGAKIRTLSKDSPVSRSAAASLCLLAAAHKGEPPAGWPQHVIAEALEADAGTPERASALHLAYWAALAAGGRERAQALLSELQSETAHAPESLAVPVAYEAAAFHLFVRSEPAAARALIEGRRPAIFQDAYLEPLIRAGLALADGDRDGAARQAYKARTRLPKALFPAVAAVHAHWLEEVEAELERLGGG